MKARSGMCSGSARAASFVTEQVLSFTARIRDGKVAPLTSRTQTRKRLASFTFHGASGIRSYLHDAKGRTHATRKDRPATENDPEVA